MERLTIDHLDHLILTTTDEAACVAFYVDVLGMRLEMFGNGQKVVQVWRAKNQLACEGKRV